MDLKLFNADRRNVITTFHQPQNLSSRPTFAEVDLEALRHNVGLLKERSQGRLFLAVIKDNGFGHGIGPSAKAVLEAGADRLGVCTLEEAAILREEGLTVPIHLLTPILESQAFEVLKLDVVPAVSSISVACSLNEAAARLNKKIKVHLKVDTGLHRFGVLPEKTLPLCEAVYHKPYLVWEGVYTHLASADNQDWVSCQRQIDLFKDIVKKLALNGFEFPIKHVGASSVAIERPEFHFDMIRPGVALFGLYPSIHQKKIVQLKPVLSLKTQIAEVRCLAKGSTIGYGETFRLEKNSRIATLPIGFGDGINRRLKKNGEVLIKGQRCKYVGNICLDLALIDLSPVPNADIGDEVVLIGQQEKDHISVQEICTWSDGIVDEVVCSLSSRIQRHYINR